jgi:hypothetical protein
MTPECERDFLVAETSLLNVVASSGRVNWLLGQIVRAESTHPVEENLKQGVEENLSFFGLFTET